MCLRRCPKARTISAWPCSILGPANLRCAWRSPAEIQVAGTARVRFGSRRPDRSGRCSVITDHPEGWRCSSQPPDLFSEVGFASSSTDQRPALRLSASPNKSPRARSGEKRFRLCADPAVRIHLPRSAQYVGADRGVLYGSADCEPHAFVDADEQNNVQRLYWVQFEGYVPSRPELKHTHDSPRHSNIGGWISTWTPGCGPRTPRRRGLRPGAHWKSDQGEGLSHAGGNDVCAIRAPAR